LIFSHLILNWYQNSKRNLPWRSTRDPYKIWLSEIILQQTKIAQGTAYYLKFLNAFPNIRDLANAPEEHVMKLWQGLGYYTRARNLHKTAKFVSDELNGVFPNKYSEIIKLKGIGPYTAAAISSICFNEKRAVVDGNVYRVLARTHKIITEINSNLGRKEFQQLADQLICKKNPGDYNQGLMDLGSTICLPKKPKCNFCPVNKSCKSKKDNLKLLLPNKIKKKKPLKRTIHYLFIEGSKHFYMQKRKQNDIWKNLYDFPQIEKQSSNNLEKLSVQQKLKKIIPNKSFINIGTSKFIHNLSHQKLHISITHIKTNNLLEISEYILMTRKKLKKIPIPKPIELFFQELE
tara:strand:- start:2369 stop:3409 length:1041 start_codon:yes stop_codon:yes gene_type:complete